ncbi:uncharacterized protein BCR38DRAFT_479365 [Pseudomassariella vexata]|uniref:Uncharacterized protein n=1 Tax=Pseudomassariella vexata TaxID=1141098 RepID=A0A1Y2D626_9PEZI|nr:uncharacterized protein BCR38DRAFT_479365 [Pseudomassariella vexata]ORY54733.1 hypothetical protein BCR38DRAFT_479365 [Pseudomassariella vexata]
MNTDVLLRRISIISLPPAFILLLAHGIVSSYAFPALGILPLACSAFLNGVLLYRDKLASTGSPIQALSPSNVLWGDTALAIFHISFLIPSWIFLEVANARGLIPLGTYGTVFMMIDFGIHTYFVVTGVWHILTSSSCDCQHCRSVMARGSILPRYVSEYTPLSEADDEQDISPDVEAGT